MIFKKNNPGCPCCECPCYKFNDNAKDSTGNKHLTATSESYADGKLGRAASFSGSSYYTHAHDDCFSPAASDTWRMWFWFRLDDVPAHDATAGYQGVITKGAANYTAGSPPTLTLDGEWGVFWRTPSASYTGEGAGASENALLFAFKSDSVSLGIHHQLGIIKDVWYFFHWTLNKSDNNGTIYARNSSSDGDVGTTVCI